MVVEQILDLDSADPPGQEEWDRQFRESCNVRNGNGLGEEQEAERIADQLSMWRRLLPEHLTINEHTSPLPHHVISLAVSHPPRAI